MLRILAPAGITAVVQVLLYSPRDRAGFSPFVSSFLLRFIYSGRSRFTTRDAYKTLCLWHTEEYRQTYSNGRFRSSIRLCPAVLTCKLEPTKGEAVTVRFVVARFRHEHSWFIPAPTTVGKIGQVRQHAAFPKQR